MKDIAELGVNLLGGCCGTNPSYIEAVEKTVDFRQTAVRHIPEASPVILKKAAVTNPLLQKMQSGQKVNAVELDPPYDANTDRIMEYALSLIHILPTCITQIPKKLFLLKADENHTTNFIDIPREKS